MLYLVRHKHNGILNFLKIVHNLDISRGVHCYLRGEKKSSQIFIPVKIIRKAFIFTFNFIFNTKYVFYAKYNALFLLLYICIMELFLI